MPLRLPSISLAVGPSSSTSFPTIPISWAPSSHSSSSSTSSSTSASSIINPPYLSFFFFFRGLSSFSSSSSSSYSLLPSRSSPAHTETRKVTIQIRTLDDSRDSSLFHLRVLLPPPPAPRPRTWLPPPRQLCHPPSCEVMLSIVNEPWTALQVAL